MSFDVPELGLTPDEMVARAIAMRPHLRADQAATEERSRYSEETHRMFTEAGFYRILQPRRFGGYEFTIRSFYRVIIEIARGCPSTGWMLCLGAGHALQMGSSYSEQAQIECFGPDGHFVAPASVGNSPDARVAVPVEGGFRVTGKWRYASGAPYSTHFMGLAVVEGSTPPDVRFVIVKHGEYEILDDWGKLIGFKGSGSNSIVVDDAFVPEHWAVPIANLVGEYPTTQELLPGAAVHGNPMYTGGFMGFAIGELVTSQVGAAKAMLDEYEEQMQAMATPSANSNSPTMRFEDSDHQRVFGTALAWVDAAYGIMLSEADIYMQLATTAMETGRPVSVEDHWRMYGMVQTAAKLAWDAGELLFRTAGSTAALDGQRMQRYWRDLCGFRTNSFHQFDFRAPNVVRARFGLPIDRTSNG